MNKRKTSVAALILIAAASLLSSHANAEGAIAIDSAKAAAGGVLRSPQHELGRNRRAEQMRARLQVVLRYPQGCGAYVIDRAPGSTIYAWAGNNSRAAAGNNDGRVPQSWGQGLHRAGLGLQFAVERRKRVKGNRHFLLRRFDLKVCSPN